MHATQTLYTITGIGSSGRRSRSLPNHKEWNFATPEEAETVLKRIIIYNNAYTIKDIMGRRLEVRPTECWLNGDAVGIWFSVKKRYLKQRKFKSKIGFDDNEEDLFDNYDELPVEVLTVLHKYEDADPSYEMCRNLLADLTEIGYSIDYGLDAIPHTLKKIK